MGVSVLATITNSELIRYFLESSLSNFHFSLNGFKCLETGFMSCWVLF
jgi:hypothetical protein